ncbi:hypothetical protein [Kineosporia mesophila]|nr:hypothetical protein [Kineosporia mesophila]MCD5351269.1 hypothetical protein [Kineosporia mesophila]
MSEQQIRQHFRTAPVEGAVNAQEIVAAGRQQFRARRRRRTWGATATATTAVLAAVTGGIALSSHRDARFELVGSGLTLAAGSSGPVQVSDDRVDLGHGLQAWREGKVLGVGYPDSTHTLLDTTDPTARWGDLGYDVATLDPEGQNDGVTAVVGTVRGQPSHVVVSIAGVTQTATIACFTQAQGWCSYAALVPVSVQNYGTEPTTVRVS